MKNGFKSLDSVADELQKQPFSLSLSLSLYIHIAKLPINRPSGRYVNPYKSIFLVLSFMSGVSFHANASHAETPLVENRTFSKFM